jgi:DNA-binding winged helix-turn-helix (wHTH) protein
MRIGFGPFVLDSGSRELLKLDAHSPPPTPRPSPRQVHLSPKAFDVLEVLVARRPNVVSKDVLLREIWGAKVVEEANLAIAVGEIRKALSDDPKSPAIILTVSRRGYRFAAEAQDLELREMPSGDGFVRCWLTWKDTTLPLRDGENLVGRHPASAVWINAASVSRAHARIVAAPSGMMVEDRGSRNGTFVDGERIEGPHPLVDGNTVTFGSEETVFRQWSDSAAVGTEPVSRTRR